MTHFFKIALLGVTLGLSGLSAEPATPLAPWATSALNVESGVLWEIGTGTTIVSSYLMGIDFYETIEEIEHDKSHGLPSVGIGNRCYIRNAIVDKNCRIGDDVRINGGAHLENTDHSLYTVKDGIIVIKKGAVLPNGFVI